MKASPQPLRPLLTLLGAALCAILPLALASCSACGCGSNKDKLNKAANSTASDGPQAVEAPPKP